MKFLIRLREQWRTRRERIKRLNAARYASHPYDGPPAS
jgi:hypothetical protein